MNSILVSLVSQLRGDGLRVAPERTVLAGIVGTAVAAAANMAAMVVMDPPQDPDAYYVGVVLGLIGFFVALLPWAAGIGFIGVPLWWLLDWAKLRGWPVAVLAGAAVPALFTLPFVSGGPVNEQLTWLAIFAVSGGLAGLTIWRIAYRRTPNLPEVFA